MPFHLHVCPKKRILNAYNYYLVCHYNALQKHLFTNVWILALSLNPSLIFSFLVPLVRPISILGLMAVHNISIGNTIPYPSLDHIINIMTSIYLYAANVWQTLPWDHKVLHRHSTFKCSGTSSLLSTTIPLLFVSCVAPIENTNVPWWH